MANVLNEIIDAVVTDLNAAMFSQTFTAVRVWQHQFKVEDYATLHVTLIPVKRDAERATRTTWQKEYQFDVVIQQKPDTTANSDVDDLGDLLDEVSEWFETQEFATATSGTATPLRIEWPTGAEAGYATEHLREDGIFTGVVRVTCRLYR